MVRSKGQAGLLHDHGIDPIQFSGLEDTAFISQIAGEHDLVINCAISYNVAAAEALIAGLGTRMKRNAMSLRAPIYIHTSGTSSIAVGTTSMAESDASGLPVAINDAKDDVYGLLQRLEAEQRYVQRTTDLAIVAAGELYNVRVYNVMPPLVYGIGTGLFNRLSIQEPAIVGKALANGFTPVIRPGFGTHNHVHVVDLASLYPLLVGKLLGGGTQAAKMPSGKKGIYFVESGLQTWLELSQGVAQAGVELGLLKTNSVRQISAVEWVAMSGGDGPKTLPDDPEIVAHSMASHGPTQAVLARELLGWEPKYGEQAWRTHFNEDFQALVARDKL